MLPFSHFEKRISGPRMPDSPDFAGALAILLPGRHRQRIHSPDHAPKRPPGQMARGQIQPVVPRMLDQPPPVLIDPPLQTRQRPVLDLLSAAPCRRPRFPKL